MFKPVPEAPLMLWLYTGLGIEFIAQWGHEITGIPVTGPYSAIMPIDVPLWMFGFDVLAVCGYAVFGGTGMNLQSLLQEPFFFSYPG